eukprot:2374733-Prymnesium_polylepis.1
MRATARRQERLRSGRYGRSSGSGRPSLRWVPSCIEVQALSGLDLESRKGACRVTWAFNIQSSSFHREALAAKPSAGAAPLRRSPKSNPAGPLCALANANTLSRAVSVYAGTPQSDRWLQLCRRPTRPAIWAQCQARSDKHASVSA